MAGLRDGWMAADDTEIDVLTSDGYTTWQARRVRYKFLEAVYNQEAFRTDLQAPDRYRADLGREEYTFIRDILGIGYALGQFWTTHTQGGTLDPQAGPGIEGGGPPSALPILMDAERAHVRRALAELWKRSNWKTKKDLVSRQGCTLGDAFVEAVDDFKSQTVRLNIVHPGRVRRVEKDPEDNVQSYEYEWKEKHPEDPSKECTYSEVCWKESGRVWYRTYLDRRPYAWPDNPFPDESEWSVPYGFVPLVHVQHIDHGIGWGQAEVEPAISGWREISDLGSCMTDWCRRALWSPHLISGMAAPTTVERAADRDKTPFLFATSQNASAKSLLVPLPVGEVTQYLQMLRDKQRDDYPEIALQVLQTGGTPSGESIRRAREPAGAKVMRVRESYNGPSERVFKMALSIGGIRGYPGYKASGGEPGITEASYANGDLDFRIGPTPVFGLDPIERAQEQQAKFMAIKSAVDAGLPLEFVMLDFGYNEQQVADMMAARDRAQQASLSNMRASQAAALADLQQQDLGVQQ